MLERILGLMGSLDGAMAHRRGEVDELLSLLGDDARALHRRVDAACALQLRHAGSPAMEAADGLIVEMLTERGRTDALGRVLASGWTPCPQAALTLAARGDRASRDVLMRFVGARPDPSAYAGALVALRDAGIPGAAEFTDTLDLRAAHGGLSLVEGDTTRGGLSQAGERGGLTSAED